MERPRKENSICLLHSGMDQDSYTPGDLDIDTRRLKTMTIYWSSDWGRHKRLAPREGTSFLIDRSCLSLACFSIAEAQEEFNGSSTPSVLPWKLAASEVRQPAFSVALTVRVSDSPPGVVRAGRYE
jgi:hypothetical protein